MTLAEWKEKTGLKLAEIAKRMGFPPQWGESLVSRHANFETIPSLETAQRYIDISSGEITLGDLLKPKKARSRR